MRMGWALGLTAATMLAWPGQGTAQGIDDVVLRAVHDCTFSRPCNWSSHALLAFSAAYALHELDVPPPAAAGAAILLYVGKEVRDHLKWRVLGTADSNGDVLSACAGALLAYYFMNHQPPATRIAVSVALDGRTAFALTLRLP